MQHGKRFRLWLIAALGWLIAAIGAALSEQWVVTALFAICSVAVAYAAYRERTAGA